MVLKIKKILIETGLIAIQTLRFFGQVLIVIIRLLFTFFRLLFRILFYDLLVAIYFKIFRIRNNELAGVPIKKLLSKEAVSVSIIILTIILSGTNLIPAERVKTASAKLSNTTASSLISSDFDTSIEEDLIEEYLNPSVLTLARQELITEESIIDKYDSLGTEPEPMIISSLVLNESSDLLLKPGLYDVDEDGQQTSSQRNETVTYTVQLGDTISSIASRFGVTINTVLWANNLSANSIIRPGNDLKILPFSGLLYVVKSGDTLSKIASTYKIEVDDIAKSNNLSANDSLRIGQELILPGATRIVSTPARRVAPAVTTPASTPTTSRPPASTQVSSDSMLWPTEGRRITQYFSWAHNGLDIANKVGTPIYAAEAGTVEIAATGWNGGYGNTIVINHGGGKKTRYAHFHTLYVRVGDRVEKGETIGTMGSTGRSTGPHLHFEVVINGTRYNPLNYIK